MCYRIKVPPDPIRSPFRTRSLCKGESNFRISFNLKTGSPLRSGRCGMWSCGPDGGWEEKTGAGPTGRQDRRRGLPPSAPDTAEAIRAPPIRMRVGAWASCCARCWPFGYRGVLGSWGRGGQGSRGHLGNARQWQFTTGYEVPRSFYRGSCQPH